MLLSFLLVFFCFPTILNASVVGKGLKCEGSTYPDIDRDYPYFIYFINEELASNLYSYGNEIKEAGLSYYLLGPDRIKIWNLTGSKFQTYFYRDTLVLNHMGLELSCIAFHSYKDLRQELKKLMAERTKKNKF